MTRPYNQLVDETIKCFRNINDISVYNIPERFYGKDLFLTFLKETFDLLFENTENLSNEILRAIRIGEEEAGTIERKDAYDMLLIELEYFNTRFNYNSTSYLPYLDEISTKEKCESADVALGSIDKLLSKLPNWLKNIIEVLREIIGFVKAFH